MEITTEELGELLSGIDLSAAGVAVLIRRCEKNKYYSAQGRLWFVARIWLTVSVETGVFCPP
jgi:hypothetical protein